MKKLKEINIELLIIAIVILMYLASGILVAYHIISLLNHNQTVPMSVIGLMSVYPLIIVFYMVGFIISPNIVEASLGCYLISNMMFMGFLFNYKLQLTVVHQSIPEILNTAWYLIASPLCLGISLLIIAGITEAIMSFFEKKKKTN